MPLTQSLQSESWSWFEIDIPLSLLYLPEGQLWQSNDAPTESEYLPILHMVQPVLELNFPDGQPAQLTTLIDPLGDLVPLGQLVHDADPVVE